MTTSKERLWILELARQCPVIVGVAVVLWFVSKDNAQKEGLHNQVTQARIKACHDVQERTLIALERVALALEHFNRQHSVCLDYESKDNIYYVSTNQYSGAHGLQRP